MASLALFDDSTLERIARTRNARKLSATVHDPLPLDRPMPVLDFEPEGDDARPPAESRDPCLRCGTRGDLGCAHQQPFVPPGAAPARASLRRIIGGKVSPAEKRSILALDQQGIGFTEIARRIGRPRSTVWSHLHRLRGDA